MISFSAFSERHITDNIDNWLKDVLAEYNIDTSEYTVITDYGANMLSHKQYHPLVVCFYHRLHTTITTSFNQTKELNTNLSELKKQ